MSTTSDGYLNIGAWQTGWTSTTAHRVVGMASRHGNARYSKVRAACGQTFCPGRTFDPTAVPTGIRLCGKCQPEANS